MILLLLIQIALAVLVDRARDIEKEGTRVHWLIESERLVLSHALTRDRTAIQDGRDYPIRRKCN